jgi:hypothetical protein
MQLISRPALTARCCHRRSNVSNLFSSAANFFDGWRSIPLTRIALMPNFSNASYSGGYAVSPITVEWRRSQRLRRRMPRSPCGKMLADSEVAHNAGFDIAFLNAELKRVPKPPIATERVIDRLVLARRKHSGGQNTLDDLYSRYGINSLRSKHGALLDAELLAAAYVELITMRQAALQLE